MVLSLAATATIHMGRTNKAETTEVSADNVPVAPMSQTATPVQSNAAPAEAPAE